MTTETLNFGADVARLLDIVTHALYSNRDVFLRELISNAADACDRLRYEAIQKPELAKAHPGYGIRIYPDTSARTLTIIDTGIGMSHDELVENLGTIAKSGTRALVEQMKASGESGPSLIGQFGVGFYSSFMAAHKVDVVSRRAGDSTTRVWSSTGQANFEISEATKEQADLIPAPSGTAVILHLKDDSSDFLLEEKIKQVIKTYSNHISLPIYLGKDSIEPVNTASALWMKSKSEITPQQYQEFYNGVSGMMALDEPALTAHWKAEGKIEFTALLFVPTMRPWDLYDPTRKHGVRLYVRRVFITDNCESLIFPWLRFLRGVIDSEDLPLNISREMLQHNLVVHKIRNAVAKRILGDLYKLSQDDSAAFTAFWHQLGGVVKEGLYDAVEHREDIFKIARFHSTRSDTDLTSLEDYISRMKDGQEHIFYISGENIETLRNSPQLEGFRKRGLEVLLMTDTIDEFWLPVVQDYQGKKFASVTKGAIDLSKFPLPDGEDKKPEEPGDKEKDQKTYAILLDFLKNRFKDDVSDVRLSGRLTDSPVCLIASENDIDLHMGRVLKIHQQYEAKVKPVLEINPDHLLIGRLNDLATTSLQSASLADAADLLLDQARIIQGEPISDLAGFARRMAEFMQRGLAA
jgi:molecular chaperone HtpG